jgi:hypothetical protein
MTAEATTQSLKRYNGFNPPRRASEASSSRHTDMESAEEGYAVSACTDTSSSQHVFGNSVTSRSQVLGSTSQSARARRGSGDRQRRQILDAGSDRVQTEILPWPRPIMMTVPSTSAVTARRAENCGAVDTDVRCHVEVPFLAPQRMPRGSDVPSRSSRIARLSCRFLDRLRVVRRT